MSEQSWVEVGGMKVSADLYRLITDEMLPGTGVDSAKMWAGFETLLKELGPHNRQLLDKRDELQQQIDDWHRQRSGKPVDLKAYKDFLKEIGYLLDEGPAFSVATKNVDAEIASLAGPQLVVPVGNARFALNAVNARWGSLYDALYVSDVIPSEDGAQIEADFNPIRGQHVVSYVANFLDDVFALANASHTDVVEYALAGEAKNRQLTCRLSDGRLVGLADDGQFAGYQHDDTGLTSLLLRNNGLHAELCIDATHPIGARHAAGLKDVVLEAALTTIQDLEDAESAVDASDKVRLYRSWLGLMKGTLEASFESGGKTRTRKIVSDRHFSSPQDEPLVLAGRSLLFARNVGLHMYSDAITIDGQAIPEGFLDALVTSLAAIHDLKKSTGVRNSKTGSVYIVKPKMHGPEEVALAVAVFARVEDILNLAPLTLKIGIMDEERRTTVNLKAAIRQAKDRVVFINTGFLDRTGDEIHTSMEAGPVLPKMEIKNTPWIMAYEDWNVDIGIETGLPGIGQIGKGMWAAPDAMKDMVATKQAHPQAGANTAWVPSPRAAVLHAMHYHYVNVEERQRELKSRERASLDDLLTLPLLAGRNLSAEEIQRELNNNVQGILGYVVRWVQQGIGCSKVPDIDNVALMEDRATLRISSQHIANWLHHGITNKAQVETTFRQMAAVVDEQNADDASYTPMSADIDTSIAYQVALNLVFDGRDEPNGYTESALHRGRQAFKRLLKQ